MDESIQVSCIIDKLPPSWKDFKHTLKHLKEELTLVELGSHLRIEESLIMQDSDKPKGKNVHDPSVINVVEHNNSSRETWTLEKDCKGGKAGNKANGSVTNGLVDGSTNSLKCQNIFNKSLQVYYVTYVSEAYFVQDDDIAWLNIVNDNIASVFISTSKLNDSILWHARLGHVHFKMMQDMSKDGLILAFDMDTKKFSINSIIESMDAIFNENRFSSVPRPSLRILNGIKDIGGSVVPQEVIEEDEVSDQHSYCFNVEDDPKTFDEAMKSHDVAFGKKQLMMRWTPSWATTLSCWLIYLQGFKQKSRINYLETYALVARISTIRLLIVIASIHNLIIHQIDVKTAFLNGDLDEEVDLTTKFLSSRFFMKDMREADVILRVIGCLMYDMTCTRPDIAFVVGKLSMYTSNPVLEGYTDASWISNTEDNSSTSS
nr:zinc finger, CCHC-type [Tanacetum cinerariifolium]